MIAKVRLRPELLPVTERLVFNNADSHTKGIKIAHFNRSIWLKIGSVKHWLSEQDLDVVTLSSIDTTLLDFPFYEV